MLGFDSISESPLSALPVAGGGAVTHDTSGVLTGAGSTVAGSAAHVAIHATSGAIVGAGSTVSGAAARTGLHATSGVVTGAGSVIAGDAARAGSVVTHDATGALVGQGSVVAGSTARTHVHASSGVLSGQGSTVAGTAAHKATHATSGALVGTGSTISGIAAGPAGAVVAGGGGWVNLPHYKQKTDEEIRQERIKLGIIPPDVAKVVVDAISQVVQARTVANPEIDLARAEKAAREAVAALKQQWTNEYIQLLSIEYARIEQENEDAQIAMLLFDM